ncbi:Ribosome-recycling factor [Rickettsiales bacterium Ac37b]|nr:Ribosome-recycling factor [Rickettsiales bacterium Ac37b]
MDKTKLNEDLKKRMDGALGVLDHELKGLRTGRASINLLDPVIVEAYGDKMHLSQVATITTPEPRLIVAQVWDKALVKSVEKAISTANLGVTVSIDGQTVRVPIPMLSQDRRAELAKLAHKYGEQAKVSIRNVRRDGMELLKKAEKDNEIAKDEHHNLSEVVQKITDEYTKKIDEIIENKEKEIMQF